MRIKKFESYGHHRYFDQYPETSSIIKSIEGSYKWNLVKNPKKDYNIDREGRWYKYPFGKYDLLFFIEPREQGKKDSIILYVYDIANEKIYYIDDPHNRFSYGRLYENDPSTWCVKAGSDFIEYLEWEKEMPTQEEIEECFQDVIDNGAKIEIMYGRGKDPSEFWMIDDGFGTNSYRGEKKILIRIYCDVDDLKNDILIGCKTISRMYNVKTRKLEFDHGAGIVIVVT